MQNRRFAFQKAALSTFQKPALHTSMTPTAVCIFFFKSRRLAVEFRPRQFRFFQKPSLRISKPGVSIFQKPAPHVSKGVTFNFSKAGASRLNDAWGLYFFFISRRLAPEFRLQWFQFFQKPLLRISKAVVFIFLKAGVTCLKKRHFQFFKSWRLAIELRLWWFQFSQKPALHASKTGLEFFQSRPYVHQNREVPFFKSRRHASQKAGLSIFEKPALHATMPPCNFEWCFFRAGFFDNIFLAIIPLSIYLLIWIFFAYRFENGFMSALMGLFGSAYF